MVTLRPIPVVRGVHRAYFESLLLCYELKALTIILREYM
jgi:hypothetical protein